MVSRERTCTVRRAEAASAWCAAQVRTCVQVTWCDTICLSVVRSPIHRLLVHQSEADRVCGLVHGLSQCAKKHMYVVNLHRTAVASVRLDLPLRKFVPNLRKFECTLRVEVTLGVCGGCKYVY